MQTNIALEYIWVQASRCGGWVLHRFILSLCHIYADLFSSSGKSSATTIENDHNFEVALGSLWKTDTCAVSVEFDLNVMDGFCIRKRACCIVHSSIEFSLIF